MTDIIDRLTEVAQMGEQWVRPTCRDAITEIHRLRRLIAEGAHTKQAYRRGQEDMRGRAAETARCVPIPEDACANEAHGRFSAALHAAITIRALPIKEAVDE